MIFSGKNAVLMGVTLTAANYISTTLTCMCLAPDTVFAPSVLYPAGLFSYIMHPSEAGLILLLLLMEYWLAIALQLKGNPPRTRIWLTLALMISMLLMYAKISVFPYGGSSNYFTAAWTHGEPSAMPFVSLAVFLIGNIYFIAMAVAKLRTAKTARN